MDDIERRMSNLLDTVEKPASIPEGAPGSLHRRAWELGQRLRKAEGREQPSGAKEETHEEKKPRTCNRHFDCDKADEKSKALGHTLGAEHCHDECCDECFGN